MEYVDLYLKAPTGEAMIEDLRPLGFVEDDRLVISGDPPELVFEPGVRFVQSREGLFDLWFCGQLVRTPVVIGDDGTELAPPDYYPGVHLNLRCHDPDLAATVRAWPFEHGTEVLDPPPVSPSIVWA